MFTGSLVIIRKIALSHTFKVHTKNDRYIQARPTFMGSLIAVQNKSKQRNPNTGRMIDDCIWVLCCTFFSEVHPLVLL